jgi:hypothetical protein
MLVPVKTGIIAQGKHPGEGMARVFFPERDT